MIPKRTIKTLKDGGRVYFGEVNESGEKDGYGVESYDNKIYYIGEFEGGKYHGFGYLTNSDYSYEGEFKYGGYCGYGILKTSTGKIYKGEWDLFHNYHGIGSYTTYDTFYQGEFVRGNKEGLGIEYKFKHSYDMKLLDISKIRTVIQSVNIYLYSDGLSKEAQEQFIGKRCEFYYDNGTYYKGEFLKDYKEGYGTLYLSGGIEIKGEWKKGNQIKSKWMTKENEKEYIGDKVNDKKEGFGMMIYDNGDKYIGQWKNDNREGYGKMFFSNGNKFEGEFKNDSQKGYGKYYYANGNWFEGEIKNNKKEGYGVEYIIDKEDKETPYFYYEGQYSNDYYHGLGKLYRPKKRKFIPSDCYEGYFKRGFKNGYGIHEKYRKTSYGYFVNDMLEGYGEIIDKFYSYNGFFSKGLQNGFGIYKSYSTDSISYWKDGYIDKYSIRDTIFLEHMIYYITFYEDSENGLGFGIGIRNGKIRYVGEVSSEEKEGYGVYYYHEDGLIYEGQWKHGAHVGIGRLLYSDGTIKEGRFADWERGDRDELFIEYKDKSLYKQKKKEFKKWNLAYQIKGIKEIPEKEEGEYNETKEENNKKCIII